VNKAVAFLIIAISAVGLSATGCTVSIDPDDLDVDVDVDLDDLYSPSPAPVDDDDPLALALDAVVAAAPPGALALRRIDRTERWARAGVAEIRSRRRPAFRDRWRVASVTKPFVATVVLQLVSEGKIALDHRADDYLPGVLPAGLPITVRQLLQHTSGLADYHDFDGLDSAAAFQDHRFEDPTARDRIALAVAHSPVSAPGAAFHYTDTNYRVLELLVQARTGRSIGDEITRRIIRPLDLEGTSYPVDDPRIDGTHLHGYMPGDLPDQPFGDQAHLVDYTIQSLDQTGGAGALISTAPDLARFFDALLNGSLLPPSLLSEMLQTVPVDDDSAALGITGYGLGLESWDLGCGTVFGHGGSTRGYTTLALAHPAVHDTAILVATQDPLPLAAFGPTLKAVATAVCDEP